MPIIVLEGPKLDKSQKDELFKAFTEIASRVTKIPQDAFTVLIKENDLENWGIGGKPLQKLLAEKK